MQKKEWPPSIVRRVRRETHRGVLVGATHITPYEYASTNYMKNFERTVVNRRCRSDVRRMAGTLD
jgi:hypothetical protein